MMQKTHGQPAAEIAHLERDWAVILAGGDGTRLKSLTRRIAGDDRPKQFCSVLGGATLLEETQRRAALELPKERTLFLVNQVHERFYAQLLANTDPANIVAQPRSIGTAPAILYGLLRVAVVDPKAVVAFFPSDHYISDNRRFMRDIRTALDAAHAMPETIILLGLEAETPEVEYGWIEPTVPYRGQDRLFGVHRFWEKPNPILAQLLQLRGCLWNSFVMVASAAALQDVFESTLPELYRSFSCLTPLFGTAAENKAIARLYNRLSEINFSHQVLAHVPHRLAVLKVSGVRWNDLGEPKRVMTSLEMAGIRPSWLDSAAPQLI